MQKQLKMNEGKRGNIDVGVYVGKSMNIRGKSQEYCEGSVRK